MVAWLDRAFSPRIHWNRIPRALPRAGLERGVAPLNANRAVPNRPILSATGAAPRQPGATPQEPNPHTNRGPKVRPNRRTGRPGLQPSNTLESDTQGVAPGCLGTGRCPSERQPRGAKSANLKRHRCGTTTAWGNAPGTAYAHKPRAEGPPQSSHGYIGPSALEYIGIGHPGRCPGLAWNGALPLWNANGAVPNRPILSADDAAPRC
jgi:hypothetical protein